jgi:hypothetical protein
MRFKSERASKQASKNLKTASYPPFLVLLVGFIGTTGYNKFVKRREQDIKEWPEQI